MSPRPKNTVRCLRFPPLGGRVSPAVGATEKRGISRGMARNSPNRVSPHPDVRTTERSPTARLAQARFAGLPPLVGPSGTSPPNRRLSARAPESEHADAWTPRRPSYSTSTRTPASTPGLRSATYRPKGGPERHSGDVTVAGLTVLRHSAHSGELRHSATMGLTPSALQRISATSGEAPAAADSGDAAPDGILRQRMDQRRASGPPRYGMVGALGAAVRSRGNRCGCTARTFAPPQALPAALPHTELWHPQGLPLSVFCLTRPRDPHPAPAHPVCSRASSREGVTSREGELPTTRRERSRTTDSRSTPSPEDEALGAGAAGAAGAGAVGAAGAGAGAGAAAAAGTGAGREGREGREGIERTRSREGRRSCECTPRPPLDAAGHERQRTPGAAQAAAAAATPSSSPPKPRVPLDVNSAFGIGHMLGSGAFGTVWQAQNRSTGDKVAGKIIEP